MPSAISAPKNTGGGGFIFEDDVCAYLLACMLANEAPFEPALGAIARLDFQTRVDGWYLDDVLITTDGASRHRIALSIKSNAQFTSSSAPADFVELVWEQWLHIGSSVFNRNFDYMGLITAPLSQGAASALAGLTSKAYAADAAQFAARIATPQWASEDERDLFGSFACPEALQRIHRNADLQRAAVLQRLRFEQFDFATPQSSSRKRAIQICELALYSHARSDMEDLWVRLREISSQLRPVAGQLTRNELVQRLRGRFQLRGDVAQTPSSELERVARIWASRLPDPTLDPTLLLPIEIDDDSYKHRPAMRALRDRLLAGNLPTLVEWHTALIEQWQHVRVQSGENGHSFFLLPEFDARAALRDLAVAIVNQFEEDDSEYQSTVLRQLTELLALHRGASAGVHAPMTWASGSTLQDVALLIERTLDARVEVLVVDEEASTICSWSTLPGDTVAELKRSMLTISCILSGIPGIDTIEIGMIAGDTRVEGSDGRGPIGGMKIQLSAAGVREVTRTKEVPLKFWEGVRAFVLVNDNAYSQGWSEIPFRRLEE